MRSFWAGVATTIVCGVFALFVLWFAVAFTVPAHRRANAAFFRTGREEGFSRRYGWKTLPSAGSKNMLESATALSGGGKRERCAMWERPYRALLLYFTAPRRESLYL